MGFSYYDIYFPIYMGFDCNFVYGKYPAFNVSDSKLIVIFGVKPNRGNLEVTGYPIFMFKCKYLEMLGIS